MQNSPYILSNKRNKAFAFSVDALIAVLLAGMIIFVLFQQMETTEYNVEVINLADSSINSRITNGVLSLTLDTNSLPESANIIRNWILEVLPQGYDVNVAIEKMVLDEEKCNQQKTFSSCFPDSNKSVATAGTFGKGTIMSNNKFFVNKQPKGECTPTSILLDDEEKILDYFEIKKKDNTALFDSNEIELVFDVNVNPSDKIVCDQNVEITLKIRTTSDVRKPIDMVLVMDRSGSMSLSGYFVDAIEGYKVWVDGNVAFMADGAGGLRAFSISDPFIPVHLSRYDPGSVIDVHGNDKNEFVFIAETAGTDQLIRVNRQDLNNLVYHDDISLDLIRGIFVEGKYVYVAGEGLGRSDSGLIIIDAGNSAQGSMQTIGRLDTTDPRDVFVDGNYAYLADGSAGLRIINITNKTNPTLVGTYNTPGTAYDVIVDGNYAYVADLSGGLRIINITNKSNPTLASYYTTGNYIRGIDLQKGITANDKNVYITDSGYLYNLRVSNPNSPTLLASYRASYNYYDVDVNGEFAFVAAYEGYFGSIDLIKGTRLDYAKEAAKSFVDFNGWQFPPDQIGLVSYSSSATVNSVLSQDTNNLKNLIDSLVPSGSTYTEDGINKATNELNSTRHNPKAIKVQILLSDGQSNVGDSSRAAQTAANNGITIFTIAFSSDADINEMQTIANITGGKMYRAETSSDLMEVFNFIARNVQELATDSNLIVPIQKGTIIVNDGNGQIIDGNLVFNSGEISSTTPFSTTYVLNFPCSEPQICNVDAFTFPGIGSKFKYVDSDNNTHVIDFNNNVTLNFLTRDINLEIIKGEIISKNNVLLDVKLSNIGELDANSTNLSFYLEDFNNQIQSIEVPALCSQTNPGCTQSSITFNSINVGNEGLIYARLNDQNIISECPNGNLDAINCYYGSGIQVYSIKYNIWRK
ncbi:MAG: VWA domain-containing protein [Candidatus Diapherotrites archaeon]